MGGKSSKQQDPLPASVAKCVGNSSLGPANDINEKDLILLKRCLQEESLAAGAAEKLPDGSTAVHKAVDKNRKDLLVALLTASGVYAPPAGFVNMKKAGGSTPLHCAAVKGYTEIVKTLLEYGADPTATNDNQRSPLEFCECNLDMSHDPGGELKQRALAKAEIHKIITQAVKDWQ
eukprot:TRINITY_DN15435_c0_g1_i1.p1 TRINITY_DN15435_c0_g1~~TRINITY_DN15435_c0_g1_i1.p1  ORF type:complete len:189 (+),score=32.49 TRINITY_DN15435_c0_g1_i1:41-568(+)